MSGSPQRFASPSSSSLPARPGLAGLPARPSPATTYTSHARQPSNESYRPRALDRSPPSASAARHSSAVGSSTASSSMNGASAGPSTSARSRWDVQATPASIAPTAAVNGHMSVSPPSGPSRSTSHLPTGPRGRSDASFDGRKFASEAPSSRTGYPSQPRAPPSGPSSSSLPRNPVSIKMSPRNSNSNLPRLPPQGPAAFRAPSLAPSAPSLDPFFYKSLGTKDYKVEYDPETDPSSVKKGKEVIYRYDGAGVELVEDPRKSSSPAIVSKLQQVKEKAAKPLHAVTYAWDKNSTTPAPPPPPSAILVTGFPGSTTADAIRSFFSGYGRIESLDAHVDKQTGGSLGICWIKYVDDLPRGLDDARAAKEKFEREKRNGTAQDGNKVALEAIARGNGQRVGAAMVYSNAPGVKVQMDGTGALSKAAAEAEMGRRHPAPAPPASKPPPPPSTATTTAPSPPSGPRPPPPPSQPVPFSAGFQQPWSSVSSPFSQPARTPQSHLPSPPTGPSSTHAGPPPPSGPKAMRATSATPNGSSNPPSASSTHQPSHARQGSNGPFPPSNSYSNAPHSHPRPAHAPAGHRPSGGGYRGGQNDPVSAAVAQAVLAAKKRLEEKQAKINGEEDMELDSDEERAIAADTAMVDAAQAPTSDLKAEDSDTGDVRDRIFFHADGRTEPFRGLRRGKAPANAIAWQASRTVLLEKLADNGMPYLSISRTTYDQQRTDKKGKAPALKGDDLEAHFADFDIDRTFADRLGWYLTFHSPGAAQKAFETLHQKPFAGAPLELTLCAGERPASPSAPPSAPPAKPPTDYDTVMERLKANGAPPSPKTSGWTDAELVEEAREIVISDLVDAFRKDVKDRVVAGKITEHLAAWEQGGSKTSASTSTVKEEPSEPVSAAKSLSSLPSFARKKNRQPSNGSQPRPSLPSSRRLSSEAPSDSPALAADQSDSETDDKSRFKSKKKHDKARRGSSSKAEHEERPAPSTKRSKMSKVRVNYTSSEDEGDDEAQVSVSTCPVEVHPALPRAPPTTNVPPPLSFGFGALAAAASMAATPPPTGGLLFGGTSSSAPLFGAPPPKTALAFGGSAPQLAFQGGAAPLPKRLAKKRAKRLAAEGRDPYEDDGDLDDEYLTEKEEKALQAAWEAKKSRALARKAAEKAARARIPTSTPDPFELGIAADEEDLYYVKLALQRFKAGQNMHPSPPPSDDEENHPTRRHATGSARTEGYYHVTVAEKLANRPPSAKAKPVNETGERATTDSGVAVSRLARANTRGLVRGMELHKKVTATDTDVLKFNQLRTRKKQLTFSRSGIEGYGLFAMEQILAGEMVIEYVGELIRQQVADRREKAYERQGIGSSYLFRVDEDLVVDATKKGNLGRLINHCCVPNCTAKIITINGVKKIVIYAKTNIEPDEEVTYDYHFAWEEEKIPCLCAHPLCRKYLN
ncbi:hypothetical protein BCR35DRAFT_300456 [Leucosporidium creatinivorum]|uniref:Histone-lysine N-methyltransferase, H3 lysine-4 specific n=1 Tax=Leucosporidium creatinivorum TaxID=106004 RepID=A0A1Y2FYX0_9BASI|nr:hypothetical protein BCR35DRAFT_300456 [Leucosporidium creatinivorum]